MLKALLHLYTHSGVPLCTYFVTKQKLCATQGPSGVNYTESPESVGRGTLRNSSLTADGHVYQGQIPVKKRATSTCVCDLCWHGNLVCTCKNLEEIAFWMRSCIQQFSVCFVYLYHCECMYYL